jgi:3',5'-cyclic AMP phosphodiesterase CpdA
MMPEAGTFTIDETLGAFTHLDFKDDPDEFQFAIITDNAGGARDGVFAKAVEMVNLLQPEFVVNAGDLIEGYSEDVEQLRAEWDEIDSHLAHLEMPFFFTPGNHDIFSETAIRIWRERFGSEQPYYHFVYKDVLFLIVDTEDPPKTVADLERDNPELYEKIAVNYPAMEELQDKEHKTPADGKNLLKLAEPVEDWLGEVNISEAQVAYFKEALQSNPDARWTFVFTHSPPHYSPTIGEKDPGNFSKIEDLLGDRDYTVFSAHTHTYHYEERNGREFITTATSGAINLPRPGAMDHVVWVTMTDKGPKIANLLLNGMMDKKGPPDDDPLEHIGLYQPRS